MRPRASRYASGVPSRMVSSVAAVAVTAPSSRAHRVARRPLRAAPIPAGPARTSRTAMGSASSARSRADPSTTPVVADAVARSPAGDGAHRRYRASNRLGNTGPRRAPARRGRRPSLRAAPRALGAEQKAQCASPGVRMRRGARHARGVENRRADSRHVPGSLCRRAPSRAHSRVRAPHHRDRSLAGAAGIAARMALRERFVVHDVVQLTGRQQRASSLAFPRMNVEGFAPEACREAGLTVVSFGEPIHEQRPIADRRDRRVAASHRTSGRSRIVTPVALRHLRGSARPVGERDHHPVAGEPRVP